MNTFRKLLLAGCAVLCFSTPVVAAVPEDLSEPPQAKKVIDLPEYRKMVIELRNAIKNDPENIEKRIELARLYLAGSNATAAETVLKNIQLLGTSSGQIRLLLCEAYRQQKKFGQVVAEAMPEQANDEAMQAKLYASRGLAYLALKNYEYARRDLVTALSMDAELLTASISLSQLSAIAGNMQEAEQYIDKALSLKPDDPRALVRKGRLVNAQRSTADPYEYYNKALEAEENYQPAMVAIINRKIRDGKLEDANALIEKLNEVHNSPTIGSFLNALVFTQKQEYEKAFRTLKSISEQLTKYGPAQYLLAFVQYKMDNYQEAQSAVNRYLITEPQSLQGRKLNALILLRRGRNQKALYLLQDLLKEIPEDSTLLAQAGNAALTSGQPALALEYYEKAVKSGSDDKIRMRLALSKIGTGNMEEGITILSDIADKSDGGETAKTLLYITSMQQKQYAKARSIAEAMKETQKDSPLPDNFIGMTYLAENNLKKAEAFFKSTLGTYPSFVAANFNLADTYRKQHKTEEARAIYKAIDKEDPGNVRALVELASLALSSNSPKEAIGYLELARRKNSHAVEPRLRLVDILLATSAKNAQRALVIAHEIKNIEPKSPRALIALGTAQLAAKEIENASITFGRLTQKAPRIPMAHHRYGLTLVKLGKTEKAQRAFTNATNLDPLFAVAWRDRLMLALLTGGEKEARKVIKEAQTRLPDRLLPLTLEGDLLMNTGKFAEAAEIFDSAIQKSPKPAFVRSRYEARYMAGQKTKAEQELSQWIEKNPQDFELRVLYGTHLIQERKIDEAISYHERLVNNHGDNVTALNNLAWLYNQKNGKSGLETSEKAFQLAPENGHVLETYGWSLFLQGDYEKAANILERATKALPYSAEAAYHYAQALIKLGKKSEAIAILEKTAKQTRDPDIQGRSQLELQRLTKR